MPKKKADTEAVRPVEAASNPTSATSGLERGNAAVKVIVAIAAGFFSLLIVGVAFAGGVFVGRVTSLGGRGVMMTRGYCAPGIQRPGQGGQNYRNGPNGGRQRFQGQNFRKNGGGQRRLRDNSPQNNAPNNTPNTTQ
ncbi:MAG: hypothetical protein ABH838_02005 [Actinomycetota bacterium]